MYHFSLNFPFIPFITQGTWEPLENLVAVMDLVDAFEDQIKFSKGMYFFEFCGKDFLNRRWK
jgi:hypothetical protein